MVKLKVVWDELARSALKDAYHYIKQDSLQQAERVKQEIIVATKKLADNPGRCILLISIEKIKMLDSALLKSTAIVYLTSLMRIVFVCYDFAM